MKTHGIQSTTGYIYQTHGNESDSKTLTERIFPCVTLELKQNNRVCDFPQNLRKVTLLFAWLMSLAH